MDSTMAAFEARGAEPCPACAETALTYLFEKKGRHFWRCPTCRLERQHPLPTSDELKAYYEQSYRQGMYQVFIEAERLKEITAAHRLRVVRPFCQPGRWLDVGAANGLFVDCLRRNGVEAEGLELAEEAVAAAQAQGRPVHLGTLETFSPGYAYSTITAFDVLEHVSDPLGFVHQVRRHLSPNGVFIAAMPNPASLYARIMGKSWFHYIPEEHLFYFNPQSLARLFARADLDLIKWQRAFKPMTFRYALSQFAEYNPGIYRVLSPLRSILGSWGERAIPCYIGELIAIARAAQPTGSVAQ